MATTRQSKSGILANKFNPVAQDKLMSIRVRASRSIFITLIAAGFVFAWRWVNSPTGDGANQKMENKNDVRLKKHHWHYFELKRFMTAWIKQGQQTLRG